MIGPIILFFSPFYFFGRIVVDAHGFHPVAMIFQAVFVVVPAAHFNRGPANLGIAQYAGEEKIFSLLHIGPPGCPELAFSTIAAERMRILSAALVATLFLASSSRRDMKAGFVILVFIGLLIY
jgi:hypothetical protein